MTIASCSNCTLFRRRSLLRMYHKRTSSRITRNCHYVSSQHCPLYAQAIAIGNVSLGNKSTVWRSREIDALDHAPARWRRRRPLRRRWWQQVPRGSREHITCTGDGHFWYTRWLPGWDRVGWGLIMTSLSLASGIYLVTIIIVMSPTWLYRKI